jgi:methylthioribose-1-phosphate isomerase
VLVDGRPLRTIRWSGEAVEVIDQTRLPHELVLVRWRTLDDAAAGIERMQVRGAPLIGVAAAHGMALAVAEDPSDAAVAAATARLAATRPTAVNLTWALERVQAELADAPIEQRAGLARSLADTMADEDVATCRAIGEAGLPLLVDAAERAGRPDGAVHVMTHCNAGWLATVDRGTALAPVYAAHEAGLEVHVWVSETRPRNQGALTAWEMEQAGIAHSFVADNACGHLLAQGWVDLVLVGADRIAANGDVANKVGTYLKALAARAAGVPFVVLAPTSTVDLSCRSGADIPIERRAAEEVTEVRGPLPEGAWATVPVARAGTPAHNPAFDVTPAALVSHIVTERGAVSPDAL